MDNNPQGTPSLLLTLLEDVKTDPADWDPLADDVKENIAAVIEAVKPPRKRHLTRDVAQKELYEILYSILENEYKDPGKNQQNADLNKAIGLALEMAIKIASGKEPMIPRGNERLIPDLHKELRAKIIAALTPKQA